MKNNRFLLWVRYIPEHDFIRNVYFQKAIVAYGSDCLDALRDTLKMPMKHTPQMLITDFDWELSIIQIYTHHRQQFVACLSVPFWPLELGYVDKFHSLLMNFKEFLVCNCRLQWMNKLLVPVSPTWNL